MSETERLTAPFPRLASASQDIDPFSADSTLLTGTLVIKNAL